MRTYIALLRGINVSGQKKILMKELTVFLSGAHISDLKYYIQSGNLIFNSSLNKYEVKNHIESIIKQKYQFEVPVLILDKFEIELIIKRNPYPDKDIKYFYVSYLFEDPDEELKNKINGIKFNDDNFTFGNKVIYVYCPGGFGKTKLNNNFFEKKLNIKATSRNWKTTLKLRELTEVIKKN